MKSYLRSSFKEAIKNVMICIILTVLFLLFSFLLNHAEAKTLIYGSGAEQVRVKHGGPTIFRFQKAVQTITGASRFEIKPANNHNPSYTVLAVTPRFTNGLNDVAFFLIDGSVVRTKILVSPSDPAADTFYDFKNHESADSSDSENAPIVSEIVLLKAMVRDDAVSGYKVDRVSQSFPSKSPWARAELIRIYRGSPFNGYVFKITNTSWKKNIEIDVRHLTVGEPNLAILSQSDEPMLSPKGKGPSETLVRVVAKNTASSGEVVLAMESEDPTSSSKKGE